MRNRRASLVFFDSFLFKVVDSRPARGTGKEEVALKHLKIFECVTKGLYYHLRS